MPGMVETPRNRQNKDFPLPFTEKKERSSRKRLASESWIVNLKTFAILG